MKLLNIDFVTRLCTIGAAILCTLTLSFPLAAQPPQPANCDQQESGERLKCKFQNIIEQQEESASILEQMGNIPPERTAKLNRQIGKTMATTDKTGVEDFKQFTKKNKAQCDIVELMEHPDANGDGDGICTGNERCAEDNSDQIGNNDGVCMPKNGKNREVCLQICDDEAVRGNPNNFDDSDGSRGADIEEILDNITDDYVELNRNLDEDMAVFFAFTNQVGDDACNAVLNIRPTKKQLDNSFMAAYIAENLAEQTDNICNLDAAGFNAAIACIVTDGIYIVAKGISDTIVSANEEVDSQTIDATLACVSELKASSGEQERQLNAMDAKMDRTLDLLDETIRLLNTPTGQRESFPGT